MAKNTAIMGIAADKLTAAIRKLESVKGGSYAGTKGVHVVFSGLNAEIKAKGIADTKAFWAAAEAAKVAQVRACKGGAIAYVFGEMPPRAETRKAAGVLD